MLAWPECSRATMTRTTTGWCLFPVVVIFVICPWGPLTHAIWCVCWLLCPHQHRTKAHSSPFMLLITDWWHWPLLVKDLAQMWHPKYFATIFHLSLQQVWCQAKDLDWGSVELTQKRAGDKVPWLAPILSSEMGSGHLSCIVTFMFLLTNHYRIYHKRWINNNNNN